LDKAMLQAVVAEKPKALAPPRVSAGVRPARASLTICWRNSAGYGGRVLASRIPPLVSDVPPENLDRSKLEVRSLLRDQFLNVNEFITMHAVREKLQAWQDDYNHHRPHGSLGHLTPSGFATMRSGQPKEAANL